MECHGVYIASRRLPIESRGEVGEQTLTFTRASSSRDPGAARRHRSCAQPPAQFAQWRVTTRVLRFRIAGPRDSPREVMSRHESDCLPFRANAHFHACIAGARSGGGSAAPFAGSTTRAIRPVAGHCPSVAVSCPPPASGLRPSPLRPPASGLRPPPPPPRRPPPLRPPTLRPPASGRLQPPFPPT